MEATRYLVIFKVMNPATVTPTQDSDTEDDFNEVPAMEGAVEKISDRLPEIAAAPTQYDVLGGSIDDRHT